MVVVVVVPPVVVPRPYLWRSTTVIEQWYNDAHQAYYYYNTVTQKSGWTKAEVEEAEETEEAIAEAGGSKCKIVLTTCGMGAIAGFKAFFQEPALFTEVETMVAMQPTDANQTINIAAGIAAGSGKKSVPYHVCVLSWRLHSVYATYNTECKRSIIQDSAIIDTQWYRTWAFNPGCQGVQEVLWTLS